jgi:hypothetical protein
MTDRKPPDLSFTSWVDKQINEAMERGAFDDLPGAGKPLPKRSQADDGMDWVRDWLRREGVSTDEMLPPPLKLRKESHQLKEMAPSLASEDEVREAVAELNHRIKEWRRIPVGPPIFVPLVDADALAASWREAHPANIPESAGAGDARNDGKAGKPRWWRRRNGRGASVRSTGSG